MRKHSYTAIAMLVLLGCLAVSAQAQCGSLQSRVNIPFQFNVAKTTLPAGEYAITCQDSGLGLLWIRSLDGKGSKAVVMHSVIGEAQDHGYLLFHRYGSQYYFAQAWIGGMKTGLEAPRSRAELDVAREFAGMKPERKEIALKSSH